MGLFNFGKKKKNKENNKPTKQDVQVKAPDIFEDDAKVQRILGSIQFNEGATDFSVAVGSKLFVNRSPRDVIDNRVKALLTLEDKNTQDRIFKTKESQNGVTGAEYKAECAKLNLKLNCRFISDIDKELEVARLYCLELYSQDKIEFWKMLQIYANLSCKTDDIYLRYLAMFDRLEQAFIALDVKTEDICEAISNSIVASYNMKLDDNSRVRKQLQLFIDEIAVRYVIEQDTWKTIYKYLNSVITPAFKAKLDEHNIPICYGFTIESKPKQNTVNSTPNGNAVNSTSTGEDEFSNSSAPEYNEFGMEDSANIPENDEFAVSYKSDSEFEIVEDNFDGQESGVSEASDNTQNVGQPVVHANPLEGVEEELAVEIQKSIQEHGKEHVEDNDVSNVQEFNNVNSTPHIKETTVMPKTSGIRKVSGDDVQNKQMYVFIKLSDMMLNQFRSDKFDSVLNQIMLLSYQYGTDSLVIQLGNASYNSLEINKGVLQDFLTTLKAGDLDFEKYTFTPVIDLVEETLHNEQNRFAFIIYDSIIDKAYSLKAIRKYSETFANNKFGFIQLDSNKETNFEELTRKDPSLFTNCNHLNITDELAGNNMMFGRALRDMLLE